MSKRTRCPVATFLPGLQLQCPPPVCQYGPPEQCPDSAAPEPPAHCMSCSRNLQKESEWEKSWKHRVHITLILLFTMSSHLCQSCRSQCVLWCSSPPSGSPRWPEMWSLHRATPCQSYTPSLSIHTVRKVTLSSYPVTFRDQYWNTINNLSSGSGQWVSYVKTTCYLEDVLD